MDPNIEHLIWKFIFRRDQSIPAVESVASDERSSLELDYLSRLMEEHTAIEGSLVTALYITKMI